MYARFLKQHVRVFLSFYRICGHSSALISFISSSAAWWRYRYCGVFRTFVYFSISCRSLQPLGDAYQTGIRAMWCSSTSGVEFGVFEDGEKWLTWTNPSLTLSALLQISQYDHKCDVTGDIIWPQDAVLLIQPLIGTLVHGLFFFFWFLWRHISHKDYRQHWFASRLLLWVSCSLGMFNGKKGFMHRRPACSLGKVISALQSSANSVSPYLQQQLNTFTHSYCFVSFGCNTIFCFRFAAAESVSSPSPCRLFPQKEWWKPFLSICAHEACRYNP